MINLTYGYIAGAGNADDDEAGLCVACDCLSITLASVIVRTWFSMCDEACWMCTGALPSEL